MRLFLAFTPSKETTGQLLDLQRRLNHLCPRIKWTPSESLHLTLLFLGAVEEKLIPQLTELLQESGQDNPCASFRLDRLFLIPSLKNPHVLAIAAEEITRPTLSNLRQMLREKLEKAGINPAPNKPPHLTLGRFPELNETEKQKLKQNLDLITETISVIQFPIWTNPSFHLIKTTLAPQGAIHIKLNTFPLSAKI
ncbi:RNA 2',3'-cyclic phosphodiesterase [Patescibacteria group bacterium]|nr:RNA 2',3'-cyclic phosphodiesterase [Patescibacteria group bacterium]MBU1868614.1 RNA 2',3'-cyclic phosphodiesterase [Patescibacteria group bacterium]